MTTPLDRMADFDLTDEQRQVRSSVKEFAEKEILPYVEQQNVFALGSDGKPDVITDEQRDGAKQRDLSPVSFFVCPSRRRAGIYPRPRP